MCGRGFAEVVQQRSGCGGKCKKGFGGQKCTTRGWFLLHSATKAYSEIEALMDADGGNEESTVKTTFSINFPTDRDTDDPPRRFQKYPRIVE
jgi:hypothetical protein